MTAGRETVAAVVAPACAIPLRETDLSFFREPWHGCRLHITVPSNALAPAVQQGDQIFLKLDAEPKDGCIELAVLEGDRFSLRRHDPEGPGWVIAVVRGLFRRELATGRAS